MASKKRKLMLSKETLRTLSTTALSQVAGGTSYSTEGCDPTLATSGFSTCFGCSGTNPPPTTPGTYTCIGGNTYAGWC